jgi:hypothetical protein
MRALLVARVYLFFRFSHDSVDYPCALVRWYSTSDEPDATTGLWVVEPESTRRGARHVVGFVRRLEARKLNLTLRGIKE